MHHVTDSLLVGNLDDARNPPGFIGGLLFVAEEHQVAPPEGLLYERIPLKEFGEADPGDLARGVAWLERYGPTNRVMVCCRAGMGRSVSMVIAYLCCVKGMSYAEALRLLRARRPGATPLPNLEQTIEQVRRLREGRSGSDHA